MLLLCTFCHLMLTQQRAFMLARQREREGQARGSRGSPGVRCRGGGAGYDGGYESDDSMDSFIDDGEEEDWRSELRQLTRECTVRVE